MSPQPHRKVAFSRRRTLGGLAAAACSVAFPAIVRATQPLQVVYPPPTSGKDSRIAYYIELLELVMRKSGAPFEMKPFARPMVGARVLQALLDQQGLTVSWIVRQRELDQHLLPVRHELDHGILGTRLLLIRARDREVFGQVHTLEQLRQFSAGQQRDWLDTQILRANHLPVVPAALYASLFEMLAGGRFDYCPRGVAEIWAEAQQFASLDLIVEPTLALRYPFETWFYVSRSNPALAQALEQGLQLAQADGSMARLFERYNGESLRRARLPERRIFDLQRD